MQLLYNMLFVLTFRELQIMMDTYDTERDGKIEVRYALMSWESAAGGSAAALGFKAYTCECNCKRRMRSTVEAQICMFCHS